MAKILFVGVDVDDTAFHGAGLDHSTGEYYEFKCKSNFGSLMKKLGEFQKKGYDLRVCYEATYLGFPLCRKLRGAGVSSDVIAPSLIPKTPGERVKTDRIDSLKLARLYAKDELTTVTVPDEQDQQIRDFIRLRDTFVEKRKRNRNELLSLCACYDLRYKESDFAEKHKREVMARRKAKGNGGSSKEYEMNHWTQMHYNWLNSAINSLDITIREGFESLISMDSTLTNTIKNFETRLMQIAEEERYRDMVLALCALKGVQTLTALKMVSELGDIRRFPHPKNLVSYLGMDIIEYTSSGKEKKFGITKMGNRRVRTALVESVQTAGKGAVTSKHLQKRRGKVVKEISDIAIRCQERLRYRWITLIQREKHKNKVKIACARELACFVWEILMKVEEMKSMKLKIAV